MNKRIIKHLIESKGMKWNFLIEKSGVSRRSFYNYINGVWDTPDKVKVNLSIALQVPVEMIEGKKSTT